MSIVVVVMLSACSVSETDSRKEDDFKTQLQSLQNEVDILEGENTQLKEQLETSVNIETDYVQEAKEESTGSNCDDQIRHQIEKTKDSLDLYLEVLGADTKNGNYSVSQDFIDNMNNVFVMGYKGSVTHGFTSDEKVIDIMDWISNESHQEKEYSEFRSRLNLFLGVEPTIAKYENITVGDCWVWDVPNNSNWVFSWFERGEIHIRWYTRESVAKWESRNQTSKEKDTITESKELNAGVHESKRTNNSDNNVNNSVTNKCEVDNCYRNGIYAIAGANGQIEYYCEEHYKEMESILGKMEQDVGNSSVSKHRCEVDGCSKEGNHSMTGLNGTTEYYCTEHYNEMIEILNSILN